MSMEVGGARVCVARSALAGSGSHMGVNEMHGRARCALGMLSSVSEARAEDGWTMVGSSEPASESA